MNSLILIPFLLSATLLLVLVFYPFISALKAGFIPENFREDILPDINEPVSIIIACYNEEGYILDKINSILHPEEWIEGSELIIVSTGSTDQTNSILKQFEPNPKVILDITSNRISKIEALNRAFLKSKHDILVFSDCRQKMKRGSIRKMINHFKDDSIGIVAASLEDTKNEQTPSFFRKLYNTMAINDSKTSSCLNIYGALYAQRKRVFREIPTNILFDDLFVLVSTLTQGERVIQEKEAIIYDVGFKSYYKAERIKRLVRGLLLFFIRQRKLIFSLPKKILVRFLIYKYLKLLMPFLLLIFGMILCYLNYEYLSFNVLIYLSLVLVCSMLLSPPFRKFTVLFVRINYYFVVATLGFILFKQRSKKWKKLNLSNENTTALL